MNDSLQRLAEFLRPTEPLQVPFLVCMLVLGLGTAIGLLWRARPARWQENWDGGQHTGGMHLDVDQGSLHDLSHAVATSPERWAEVIPATLLVIGLLGTFVGLGMALDAAGHALGDVSRISETLKDLGTKFKTSTWGILGYLLFRAYQASLGYESRRLRWCVSKMREVAAQRQRTAVATEAAYQRGLLEVLGRIASETGATARHTDQTQASLARFVAGTDEMVATLGKSSLRMSDAAASIAASASKLRESSASLEGTIENFGTGVSEVLAGVKQDLSNSIDAFNESTNRHLGAIASDMQRATDGIAGALQHMRGELSSAIKDMEVSFGDHMTSLQAGQQSAGESIQEALTMLSRMVEGAQAEMASALEKQSRSHQVFAESQEALIEGLDGTNANIRQISTGIVQGLDSVSRSSLRVAELNKRFELVSASIERCAQALDDLVKKLQSMTGVPPRARNSARSLQSPLASTPDKGTEADSENGA